MIRGVLLALALALVAAAPAQAGILSSEDATDLAQSLADAQAEQGVCYGWQVTNNFASGPDTGSSTGGPGTALSAGDRSCSRGAVVLEGSIDYACSSCESSDSASISIRAAGMADPPTVGDLESLGLKAGDLTGDMDDTTLVNMVNVLPLLVADRGNAPYVAYEPATNVPAADHATGKPGSDVLRDSWFLLVLCVLLICCAPAFYLYKRAQHRAPGSSSAPSPRPPDRPAAGPPPAPSSPAT